VWKKISSKKVFNFFKVIFYRMLNKNMAVVRNLRGPFEKFVDWQQCAAVMQREGGDCYAKL
jgi:hypothetical protein